VKTVLRVGLLDDGSRASICLIRNISETGIQVKAYAPLHVGKELSVRVGDEEPIPGTVVWVKETFAGIRFANLLAPEMLLRASGAMAAARRRSAPRLRTEARATLRTGGDAYSARICDISTSGAKLRTSRPIAAAGSAALHIPELPPLTGFIRWIDDLEVGLSFESPIPITVIANWLGLQPSVTAR